MSIEQLRKEVIDKNELLLKHLIPYSFRSVYCSIINTVTSIMNVPVPIPAQP